MSSWTSERIELLIKLRRVDRLSSSLIASRLGGVTRNADIGKLHRLGLSDGQQPTSRRVYKAGKRRRDSWKAREATQLALINARRRLSGAPPFVSLKEYIAEQSRAQAELAAILAGPDLVIPPDERKALLDLEPGDCRWPFGDPKDADFHFCNGKAVMGLPYCAFHCRRAFNPVQPGPPRVPYEARAQRVHPLPVNALEDA